MKLAATLCCTTDSSVQRPVKGCGRFVSGRYWIKVCSQSVKMLRFAPPANLSTSNRGALLYKKANFAAVSPGLLANSNLFDFDCF